MALPDSLKLTPGAAKIWGNASGTGNSLTVTDTISLNNLANNAGRMGAAVDLGANMAMQYAVFFMIESGTAPTAGQTAELYLASSYDNTNWPGQTNGADGAYPATINSNKLLLGPPLAILVAYATANVVQSVGPIIWTPPARYVCPVVLNFIGQAVRNVATAQNNLSRIILLPLDSTIND